MKDTNEPTPNKRIDRTGTRFHRPGARRSRDLWFGSHLLSEISRAAARGIAVAGGQLIFPALDFNNPELEPCDGMTAKALRIRFRLQSPTRS